MIGTERHAGRSASVGSPAAYILPDTHSGVLSARRYVCKAPLVSDFSETAVDQFAQTVQRGFLALSVRHQGHGHSFCDTERKHAEQALGVDAAVILFNPDGARVGISLLNEEHRRSCMQTEGIIDDDFA